MYLSLLHTYIFFILKLFLVVKAVMQNPRASKIAKVDLFPFGTIFEV